VCVVTACCAGVIVGVCLFYLCREGLLFLCETVVFVWYVGIVITLW